MTKIIKTAFFYAGLSIISLTAFSLVTGETYDKIVLSGGEEVFLDAYERETFGNGTKLHSDKLNNAWDTVIKDNVSVKIDDENMKNVLGGSRGFNSVE